MDKKRLMIMIGVLVAILVVSGVSGYLVFNKKPDVATQQIEEENRKMQEAKTIKFEVIRVLPSGFSPKEVIIEKGMIVRFTNPMDDRVAIKWEGDQYTSGEVINGSDLASKVFNKEGEYNFSDGNSNHGKITVK